MRGRYLIRSPHMALAMGIIDRTINAVRRSRPPIPRNPERILVANWAHLGDLLTTLPAIDWLRRRYPQAEIGLLTGSWSAPIAEAAKMLVSRVHVVDHFMLARSGTRSARLVRHRESAREAQSEIRTVGYDVALDFYPFFPNASMFLAGSGVPVRIGWSSGGLGGFYTHQVRRWPAERHVIDYHRDILSVLDPQRAPGPGELQPIYPGSRPASPPWPLDDGEPYVVLHTGAGAAYKEWPTERWIELAQMLTDAGSRVVLAGAGAREAARNDVIASAIGSAIDLTGKLDWTGLVGLVASCETLYCLDSISAHIGAAFARRTVVVSSGATHPAEWGPLNSNATLVTGDTPCAPCHRSGCEAMACLASIRAEHVWAAGRTLEAESRVSAMTGGVR